MRSIGDRWRGVEDAAPYEGHTCLRILSHFLIHVVERAAEDPLPTTWRIDAIETLLQYNSNH
jgi:hypothetical protein